MSNSKSVLFTTGEVAERFRVSSGTIRNLVSSKSLTPVRIGDRLLFNEEELARFEREGSKSGPHTPVKREELETFIHALAEGPLRFVLTAYRDRLDGKTVDAALVYSTAIKIAGPLFNIIETKITNRQPLTDGEKFTVRCLGQILDKFSGEAA